MKKIIINLAILIALFSSSSAMASSYVFNTKSLVGIEGTYNTFDISNDAAYSDELSYMGAGIKIGAQSDNYRLFLSARNNFISDYDSSHAIGAEAQFLMNFSSVANMFLGVSTGTMSLKFDDEASLNRKVSSKYYGGDIGFNLHLSDTSDLEIGYRKIRLTEPSHLQGGVTYDFENITNIYISLIFKYSMDEY